MTLAQQIGQMLMTGFSGDSYSPELNLYIKKYHIGGVGLFNICPPPKESNITSPAQLKELCSRIQAEASVPLFIALDQEGGRVARLSEKNGFTRPPSPKEMAAHGSVGQEYALIARSLKEYGVNMNFAPCCDVDVYPQNPIIGALGRSFSGDAFRVLAYAREAWQAQVGEKIISCLKHFPGHGSSRGDSHLGMADISGSFNELEFEPFRGLIAQGFEDFILSAHVINRNISPLPASLAPEYPALLRSWGFRGLIITDDLKMGAIEKEFGLEEALILAVNAGNDVIASFNNLPPYEADYVPRAVEILLKAVEAKKIPEGRINESAERVRAFKKLRLAP